MKYKLLGKSGLRVSDIALGTMTFGDRFGWGADKTESRKIFDSYVDAGGNLIDTANVYTGGDSEEFVGEFISSEREKFVVTTKYSLTMNPHDPNAGGNHRKNLIQSLDASLKRLKTDYIDMYWLHAWDFMTPVEEIMRALDDQVRAGKILYIGISDTPAWIVAKANTMAELRGWTPFTGLQVSYSLVQREAERDLIPMAKALDIGVFAWGPLGGGVLTGKYKGGRPEDSKRVDFTDLSVSERNRSILETVESIAQDIGRTPAQVALNWIRQQEGTTIPIIGARTEKQIKDNLNCLTFELTTEQMDSLTRASSIPLGFPHDFLEEDTLAQALHGQFAGKIATRY
ncbi:aryl-alcohol dehydrogenase-like predicted oxidoreductase [Paenibacillus rhizosphaerae]|uniref:Aryl-alcohol dehydrogenase-like predicted oxidoreductase n=1 Tax=Paenibacillus rhizosphaerae TaxID=297318 RepID=A0A839TNP6_9BACL|nr:aldo/keto reductase [Paenibacillus rhizosphaerae]MBB3128416.1 aryl-alcohol dehydrogenase-like predicted oxidoreductase [Paenibacillus rhizosphaerae]